MSGQTLELLCFRVGGRAFAVDIMGIREILRSHTVTPVPNTPPSIAGVLNLRGELVPVIDLHRALLHGERGAGEEEQKLVVVRAGGRTAGLLVDTVLEVVSIELKELNQVPGSAAGGDRSVVAAFRRSFEGEEPLVVLLLRLGTLLEETGVEAPGGKA